MSEPTATCVICTNDRPAIYGLVCTQHYERVAQWLHEIEVEAAILSPVKSMQQSTGNRGAGLTSERAPARLDVIAMRDVRTRRWEADLAAKHARTELPTPKSIGPWCLFCEHQTCTAWRAGRRRDQHNDEQDAGSAALISILGVLESWARLVREERGLSATSPATVTSERRTLTAHWEWICGQEWVDEFVGELRLLRQNLKSANGTQDDKPYGRCYLPDEDGLCGGPIWLDMAAGQAHCGKCRQTWDGPEMARMKWELDQIKAEKARPRTEDGRRMVSEAEAAALVGKKVKTFKVWAWRNGIKAVSGHYDPAWLSKVSA